MTVPGEFQPTHNTQDPDINLDPAVTNTHETTDAPVPTPEQQVETFLEDNRTLFVDVRDRWAEVKRIRDEDYTPFMRRGAQDALNRIAGVKAGEAFQGAMAASLYELAVTASNFYRDEVKGKNMDEVQVVEALWNYERGDNFDHKDSAAWFEVSGMNAEAFGAGASEAETASTYTLALSYAYGFQAQEKAVSAVEQILADDHLAMPFCEKVLELAVNKGPQLDRSLEGLLEVLATYNLEQPNENMLQQAVTRALRSPGRLQQDFAKDFLSPTDSKEARKKVAADLAGAQLLVQIITEEYGHPFEDLTAKVAERFRDYGALRAAYKNFEASHVTNYWKHLQQSLKPYEKSGRIPLKDQPMLIKGGSPAFIKMMAAKMAATEKGRRGTGKYGNLKDI